MRPLEPNTRTRLSIAELSAVPFAGLPASVRVSDAISGVESTVTPVKDLFALPTTASPNVLDVTWDMDGIEVSCEVEVVSSRLCSLDEIRAYRGDQYQNAGVDADDVFAARQRAEAIIERAANRHFQPVAQRVFVDRPNCSARTQLMADDGSILHDVLRIEGCVGSGREFDVFPVRPGSQFVDVSSMRPGQSAVAVAVCGMPTTPPEARDAVRELAAWLVAEHAEPDNALSMSSEAGVVNFVVSGVNGETPLPEVNALIKRYERRDMVIG